MNAKGSPGYIGTIATIDGAKIRIISSLSKLAECSGIKMALPSSITEELFRTEEEANKPPEGHETWEWWIGVGGGFK